MTEPATHPRPINNPPGRSTIHYRAGDFRDFRRALLAALEGETRLGPEWRPAADGDFGVMLVEWWAYLADVLTFYTERAARQAYLRTADLPESVLNLIASLGYRPRPAIAAVGVLGAIPAGTQPVAIPSGLPIQSKPGPGETPQIFEVDSPVTVSPTDVVPVDPPDPGLLLSPSGRGVWLKGSATTLKPGDQLLLVHRDWAGGDGDQRWAWVKVQSVVPGQTPRGRPLTLVNVRDPILLSEPTPLARNFRLLRATQIARPYQHSAGSGQAVAGTTAHLEAIASDLKAGDMALFDADAVERDRWREWYFRQVVVDSKPRSFFFVEEPALVTTFSGVPTAFAPSTPALRTALASIDFLKRSDVVLPIERYVPLLGNGPSTTLVRVSGSATETWYSNAIGEPTEPPPATKIPIAVLHTRLGVRPTLRGDHWDTYSDSVVVRHSWRDVGELTSAPATHYNGGSLLAVALATLPALSKAKVLLEAATGVGSAATADAPAGGTIAAIADLTPGPPLPAPLTLFASLLSVSRGQTVPREILGSGDSRQTGQKFYLKNSPLTYLPYPNSATGAGYTSTLKIWVDQIEWKEVPSFYGRSPSARVFITNEDESGRTRIEFGDGEHGARLPSGVNNVVAKYRYGAGAAAPAAGSLTTLSRPLPGLRAVRNPVAVGGGADADPHDRIRQFAPRSVLTFGRVISGEDYEAIATLAPGVARARVYWSFDGDHQRNTVTVYVGDTPAAVAAAQTAITAAADPNRPVRVRPARAISVYLQGTVVIDPTYEFDPVLAAVRRALTDADTGLFGVRRATIGRRIYDSQISEACLAVPGVVGLKRMRLIRPVTPYILFLPTGGNHLPVDPDEGTYYRLDPNHLNLTAEAANAS